MKNSTLKLLATFVLMLLVYTVNAQIVDVCQGEVKLQVDITAPDGTSQPDGTIDSYYTWTASNGTIPTDIGTPNAFGPSNKASFDFSTATIGDVITIEVVETNGLCSSNPPTEYQIRIVASPVVTAIAATSPAFCDGGTDVNQFTITGTPGATVEYSLVDTLGNTITGTVVIDATLGIATVSVPAGVGTTTITIDSVANTACTNTTATAAWTASITVSAPPVTSAIVPLP